VRGFSGQFADHFDVDPLVRSDSKIISWVWDIPLSGQSLGCPDNGSCNFELVYATLL
jgi:hypothetical protein